jgi:Protein of unknown function (DUF2934)
MSSRNVVKERIVAGEIDFQAEDQADSPEQHPSQEEIRRRAFEIHIERGGIHGCDLDDWMQAEKELTEKLHR